MGSLPRHDAVLIITHPGGGKSFDYDDYWDGADLIYSGKGQEGDQKRTGENRYVGDNLRMLLAFEQAGPAQLRYLGSPICVDEWPETAPDRDGDPRRVIRFRLRFNIERPAGGEGGAGGTQSPSADPDRQRARSTHRGRRDRERRTGAPAAIPPRRRRCKRKRCRVTTRSSQP